VSVDPVRFAPRPPSPELARSLGLRDGRFVLVHVGKIDRGRGQDVALDLTEELERRGIESTLILVGFGPFKDEIARRAKRRRLDVILPGYRESNLPEIYNLAHVGLFPAAGSDRGHRMILEAFASGLPVLSLPIPGADEIVRDGVDGFVVRGRAAAEDALEELATDPARREAMGDAARRRVLESYADPILARRLANLYSELL